MKQVLASLALLLLAACGGGAELQQLDQRRIIGGMPVVDGNAEVHNHMLVGTYGGKGGPSSTCMTLTETWVVPMTNGTANLVNQVATAGACHGGPSDADRATSIVHAIVGAGSQIGSAAITAGAIRAGGRTSAAPAAYAIVGDVGAFAGSESSTNVDVGDNCPSGNCGSPHHKTGGRH